MGEQTFPVYLSTHAASVAHLDPACARLRNRPEFFDKPEERLAQAAQRPGEVVLLALVGGAPVRLLRRCSGCGFPDA